MTPGNNIKANASVIEGADGNHLADRLRSPKHADQIKQRNIYQYPLQPDSSLF
ncbi:hypothetical protein DPMN_180655 [Dreissena polymorpha]|uniref:Uncharacterized protein n=1 Tax=Dreissena polymorpha TaxID=45954 RepID=A0A9D4EG92_DREPO|nr:hypothetical protein DPMN_180655 [Dreissena polymorpha]